jgi:DNA-binding GntR family transcriptional regulator
MAQGTKRRHSAVERAYQSIRRSIHTGAYAPHARLTEQEIAASSGVSRTPVREALRRLSAEGLVVFQPNQGAVVAGWSEDDIEDIFALRTMLESYAVARAATRIDQAGIDQLRELADQIRDAALADGPDRIDRVMDLNGRFHRALIEAAGSDRLRVMFGALIETPLIARSFRAYERDELLRATEHHREIVDALQARDADWASSTMRSHILAAAHIFREHRQADAAA